MTSPTPPLAQLPPQPPLPQLPQLPPWPLLDPLIARAFEEDLVGGDVTTEACVDPSLRATATFVVRSAVVVAGLPIAARVFSLLDPTVHVVGDAHAREAQRAQKGDVLLTVSGSARTLLMGERVALNFLQRTTGIATLTRAFVDAVPAGAKLRIADTRKTTPGLRVVERYAVRCGGGRSHRDMLGSAVLIKDNHLVAAGGVKPAIARARAHAPHTSKIECEVESLAQLDEALEAGADVVLLDNMDDATTAKAVATIRARAPHVTIEASGRMTPERVAALAALDIDVVSVGALTHSAPAADIALDLRL
jgi:nicotinate-nucleotide pyrophosphorylase (carboxylating)